MKVAFQLAVMFGLLSLAACNDRTADRVQVERDVYNAFVAQVEQVRNERFRELSEELFLEFSIGFCNMVAKGDAARSDIAVVIDYSKPSNEERWKILDLKNLMVESSSLVAHGRNTGELRANRFSNLTNSKKTSLGFFATGETYTGKHGYSLKLEGLELNLNSNARKRAIVVHGADYVSKEFIRKNGRLGRSWGCPALPQVVAVSLIDKVKDGACLYSHGKYQRKQSSSDLRLVSRVTITTFQRIFANNR